MSTVSTPCLLPHHRDNRNTTDVVIGTTYKVISIKTDAQYPPSILATCNPCLLSPLNHFLSTGLAFSNTISQYNIKRGQYQINLDIQLSKLRFEV